MSAIQPWCYLIGIHPKKLTKEESLLFEAEIFARICEEIKEVFRCEYKEFFRLMNFTIEMEEAMLEAGFLRLIINDILVTGEYDLKGIAYYANTHEDVVQEVIAGVNTNPSAAFLQKIIELHRSVRRDLYHVLMQKIVKEYHVAA
ncbi:hypothetical protein [Aquicella lusitana]|uniref:Uncharacterized protein n=1 Tax=Aquicella lusitana TaxID=254246 RepID=A0A370GWK3_9COXI|nr:hypothetical protein [Aquicella lusitana]RDI48065.1 hypothetical protein C8D86_10330 [Aquicella lusitana]VVC72919.1 hypothetical protein AQULUS_06430 [Aquicella lusitana]